MRDRSYGKDGWPGLVRVDDRGAREVSTGTLQAILKAAGIDVMRIAGVPDEHLERYHRNDGHGRGVLGYRHRPSGISVERECAPGAPVRVIDEELRIELREALRVRGILSLDADPSS